MTSETDILLIEIQQAIKIKQQDVHASERVLMALEQSKRLLTLKEKQLTEFKQIVSVIVDVWDGKVAIIKSEYIESIRKLINNGN